MSQSWFLFQPQQTTLSHNPKNIIREHLLIFSRRNLEDPVTEEVLSLLEELHQNVLKPIHIGKHTLHSLPLNESEFHLVLGQLRCINELFTLHYDELGTLTGRQERHYAIIQRYLDLIISHNSH